MDYITIPAWLGNEIERLRDDNDSDNRRIIRVIMNVFGWKLDMYNIDILTLARAIQEGFEIEKSYLTLEEASTMPEDTYLKHEQCNGVIWQVVNADDGTKLFYGVNVDNSKVRFCSWMLIPEWYVVNTSGECV